MKSGLVVIAKLTHMQVATDIYFRFFSSLRFQTVHPHPVLHSRSSTTATRATTLVVRHIQMLLNSTKQIKPTELPNLTMKMKLTMLPRTCDVDTMQGNGNNSPDRHARLNTSGHKRGRSGSFVCVRDIQVLLLTPF